MSTPLRSCLYECRVMHHRLQPKEHRFEYNIFMFALDLDEVAEVAARVRGFSHNRRNLYEFRDADHLVGTTGPLKEKLRAYLAEQGLGLPADGRVRLVTLPRVAGYLFNPVSFYFCTDAAGQPLCSVAQVGNTFGEMKLYPLPRVVGRGYAHRTPKHFYVSPFSRLEQDFEFILQEPGAGLAVRINNREGAQEMLRSRLTGRRVPLTTGRLLWLTLKYPFITLQVIGMIHWHALRLWLRRVPWFAKAHGVENQRGVLRPHATLTRKPV